MRRQIAFSGAVALAGLAAAPALAGAVSFVSVTGDDTRSCATPGTACRTFQRAHDATSAHGEIIALTPGDYRPLTITKSISVTGVEGAGIFGGPSGTIQITVAAGASDVVYLTGLTLDGSPDLGRAVSVTSVGHLTARKCTIVNLTASAFFVDAGRALIEDSSASQVRYGLFLTSSATRALVHRFVATASESAGIHGEAPATIAETSIAGSGKGVELDGFMSRSVVTGSSLDGVKGAVTSAGDNFIRGNGTNVTGTITNIGRQ
jgi:hypothetical protein